MAGGYRTAVIHRQCQIESGHHRAGSRRYIGLLSKDFTLTAKICTKIGTFQQHYCCGNKHSLCPHSCQVTFLIEPLTKAFISRHARFSYAHCPRPSCLHFCSLSRYRLKAVGDNPLKNFILINTTLNLTKNIPITWYKRSGHYSAISRLLKYVHSDPTNRYPTPRTD